MFRQPAFFMNHVNLNVYAITFVLFCFFSVFLPFFVVLSVLYYCLGVKVIFSGDKLQKSDKIRLMISNHPTSLDYIWLWFLQHHQCSTSNMRFVVNAQGWSFKILPLIGPIIEKIENNRKTRKITEKIKNDRNK